eukprot:12888699-Prorocentrum_lima.AAC.1
MWPYQIVRLAEILQLEESEMLDLAGELDEAGNGYLAVDELHEIASSWNPFLGVLTPIAHHFGRRPMAEHIVSSADLVGSSRVLRLEGACGACLTLFCGSLSATP